MDECGSAMPDQACDQVLKRKPWLRAAIMPTVSTIWDPMGLHRAPVPEDEPLPGEDPEPDEDPVPHPDPVIREPEEAPPLELRLAFTPFFSKR